MLLMAETDLSLFSLQHSCLPHYQTSVSIHLQGRMPSHQCSGFAITTNHSEIQKFLSRGSKFVICQSSKYMARGRAAGLEFENHRCVWMSVDATVNSSVPQSTLVRGRGAIPRGLVNFGGSRSFIAWLSLPS